MRLSLGATVRRSDGTIVGRVSTVPANLNTTPLDAVNEEEVLLDEYVAELQSNQAKYFSQLSDMRKQILAINENYMSKEDEMGVSIREATTSKQMLEAELSILSDSHQRLLRSNAELEERVSVIQTQMQELVSRNDFLESDRIQTLAGLELPHPDLLKDLCVTIAEKEAAEASQAVQAKALEACQMDLKEKEARCEELDSKLESLNIAIADFQRSHDESMANTQDKINEIVCESELKDKEISRLVGVIDGLRQEEEVRLSKEEAMKESDTQMAARADEARLEHEKEIVMMQGLLDSGRAEACTMIDALQSELAQLKSQVKIANERLRKSLEEGIIAEEKMQRLESLLTSEQKSKCNVTPSKGRKSSGNAGELKRLQMEATELRLKLAEMQAGKENEVRCSLGKRREIDTELEMESKNRRVSLDQNECRQQ
jgi:septum formation topological specificity factor MinE